jgi:hypothetical protein
LCIIQLVKVTNGEGVFKVLIPHLPT